MGRLISDERRCPPNVLYPRVALKLPRLTQEWPRRVWPQRRQVLGLPGHYLRPRPRPLTRRAGQRKRARGDTFDRELGDAVWEGDDGCRRISPKPPLRSP